MGSCGSTCGCDVATISLSAIGGPRGVEKNVETGEQLEFEFGDIDIFEDEDDDEEFEDELSLEALLDKYMPEAPKAAFNAAVDDVLGSAIAVSNQRGATYSDSWKLENVKTTFLDAVLRETEGDEGVEAKRLMIVASLCDVKVSRFGGTWHDDNGIDLINYMAALTKWMRDYRERQF
jgi:hypothetical protein